MRRRTVGPPTSPPASSACSSCSPATPGQILSRQQLLSEGWGDAFDPSSNVVDVCVNALRGKLGPEVIETIRGAGYRVPAP